MLAIHWAKGSVGHQKLGVPSNADLCILWCRTCSSKIPRIVAAGDL